MPESLTIVQDDEERTVGRTFSVRLVAYLVADDLWDGGGGKRSEKRPIFIVYLGTPQESKAFTANFRDGHVARAGYTSFHILKSHPHVWSTQTVPATGDLLTVAYLPELFHLDPVKTDPDQIRFVFAPPAWWLEREAPLFEDFDDPYEAARATLFAAYLDSRTRLPLVADPKFHLLLYRAALEEPWMTPARSSGSSLGGRHYDRCHLVDPHAVSVSPSNFQILLVQQTKLYFEDNPHGTTRLATDRRVLPDPCPSPTQHCLDFGTTEGTLRDSLAP